MNGTACSSRPKDASTGSARLGSLWEEDTGDPTAGDCARRAPATRLALSRWAAFAWLSSDLISLIRYDIFRQVSGVPAKDFLDELTEERTRTNPDFPGLVEAALRTRQLLRSLAARRRELGLSQTQVAARMRTSQSALARFEAGGADPRVSTVQRYAHALGEELGHQRAAGA